MQARHEAFSALATDQFPCADHLQLFKELGFLVRCSTAREAGNIGIFFGELMAMVTRWRGAKEYAQECSASEAFRSYKAGELHAVSYPEFVKLSANWHRKLTLDVFKTCLASGDYMQMKNALLVLNRMVRIYPATREDAQELLRTLGPLRDADPREDLKILARMYCTALEMALRDKNRAVVDSRQEYAGLPPPPKKKVKPAPKPQTAAPGKEAERGAAEGPTGDGKREGGGPGPGDGAAALVLVLGKKADRPVSTRQRDRAEDRQRQRGSEREQRPTRADREKRDELERRGRAGRDTKGAEGPSSGDAGQGGGKGDARRGSAGEELDRSERPSNRSNLDTERRPLSDRGRGRERDERRGNLRVEASEFVPGSSKDSGRERRFDDTPAADGERDAKRPRRSIRDESRQGDRQDRNRERDQLRQPATKGDTNDAQGQNATSRPERSFETDQPEEPSHASGVVEEDRGRQRERGRNRDRERELPQRSDTRDEKAQDDRKGGSGSGRPAGETDAERLQDGARGNISRTPTEREASGSQVEAPPPQQAEVLGALPPKEQEGIASPGDAQPEKAGRKHARDEEERENRHKRHKRDRKEKDRKRDRKDRSKSKDRDQDREATKPREVPEDDIRPPARLLGRLGTGSGAALGAGVKDRGNGGGGDSRGSGRRERRGDRSRR